MQLTNDAYPSIWDEFDEPTRAKAIEVANAMMDEGRDASMSVPLATEIARRWAVEQGIEDTQSFDPELPDGDEHVHVVPMGQQWGVEVADTEDPVAMYHKKSEATRHGRKLAWEREVDLVVHDHVGDPLHTFTTSETAERTAHVRPADEGWMLVRGDEDEPEETFESKGAALDKAVPMAREEDRILVVYDEQDRIGQFRDMT